MGEPIDTLVTLSDGGQVVDRADSHGQWLELRGPAGRELVLGLGPLEDGVSVGQLLTLLPGERLWLGEVRIGPTEGSR